jgi:hypothetical protein
MAEDEGAGSMGLHADQSARLVALFVLGWLLLSYPLLALFNRKASLFGLPLLYVYLFGAWALLIALMAWAVARARARPPADTPAS